MGSPLDGFFTANTALDAAVGRTTVAPPFISNATPHFAWGGAGPGKEDERISHEPLLVDGPPIHWPRAALARQGREGDQAGERDRRRVRGPWMARDRRRPRGGGDDDGEVPDPPHGAREDDNLPFNDAGFVNDSPDDTIPDCHRRRPAQLSSRSSHRLEGARVWTSPNRRVIVQPQVIKTVFRSTFGCTTSDFSGAEAFKGNQPPGDPVPCDILHTCLLA
jgi:hypothetical protein